MKTGVVMFKNGAQLELNAGAAQSLALALDAYWKAPTGDKRFYIAGSSAPGGGHMNFGIDLELVMLVTY